jgi:hypothetical protein
VNTRASKVQTRRTVAAVAAMIIGTVGASGEALAGWTVIKLHPSHPAALESRAYSTRVGVQAGYVYWRGGDFENRLPARWSSSAATWAFLHNPSAPAGAGEALSVSGTSYAGFLLSPTQWPRATLWVNNGVGPTSVVSLHPSNATSSAVNAIHGSLKVGHANGAAMWDQNNTYINLAPPNTWPGDSQCLGVHGSIKVGWVIPPPSPFQNEPCAVMWDANNSLVYLTPPGTKASYATACYGNTQVGYRSFQAPQDGWIHAYRWNGQPWQVSPGVNLHPPSGAGNFKNSYALAAGDGVQAGYVTSYTPLNAESAAIWFGTPASFQNLGALVPGFVNTRATGVEKIGTQIWVSGYGKNTTVTPNRIEALLWHYSIINPDPDPVRGPGVLIDR